MISDVLNYSVEKGIAKIELNRPDSINSFNADLRTDILAAIQTAEKDNSVRVMVFKGAGRGFCAGADLSEGLDKDVEAMLVEEYMPFLLAISESNKICIAQVHGSAAGIGAALAMVCDLVVMSEDAYVYLAFAAIGLVPDGGLNWHLLHTLGYRRAFETIVEGKKLTAQECLDAGIANAVVSLDQLDPAVEAKAEKLAKGAPLAQSAAKKILRQMEHLTLEEAIRLEAATQQPLTESEDCRNAVDAFFKKEKPVFRGK